jgi:hypothetical protein
LFQRKKKEPRPYSYTFRLSESEAEQLERIADELELSKTKVVVRGIRYVEKLDILNKEK